VTGKSWSEFLEERVFQPLQMRATRMNNDRTIIQNPAGRYRWENQGMRHDGPQGS
jgi:CubicO group peptidase (beta-lactamase class C family)